VFYLETSLFFSISDESIIDHLVNCVTPQRQRKKSDMRSLSPTKKRESIAVGDKQTSEEKNI
jgi:hypothetical protein